MQIPPMMQGVDYFANSSIDMLIGMEVGLSNLMFSYTEYLGHFPSEPTRPILQRHHETIRAILDKLANIVEVHGYIPDMKAFVAGTAYIQDISDVAAKEPRLTFLSIANTQIITFLGKAIDTTSIESDVKSLYAEITREHRDIHIELFSKE